MQLAINLNNISDRLHKMRLVIEAIYLSIATHFGSVAETTKQLLKSNLLPATPANTEHAALKVWAAANGVVADEVDLGKQGRGWAWRNTTRGSATHWIGVFSNEVDALHDANVHGGQGPQLDGQPVDLIFKEMFDHAESVKGTSTPIPSGRNWSMRITPADLARITSAMILDGANMDDTDFPSGPLFHMLLCSEIAQLIACYAGGDVIGPDSDGTIIVTSDGVLEDRHGIWRLASDPAVSAAPLPGEQVS